MRVIKNPVNLIRRNSMKKLLVIFLTMAVMLCGYSEDKKIIVGISKIVSHPALDSVEKGIQDKLKELGFNNIQFDLQNANGDINTSKQIANKFKSENVNVAVGIATPTAQALVNTLKDIPVVFSAVTDPVGAGLVKSLSAGDTIVTGVSDMTPIEEQIKMLVKIKKIKSLGNIYANNEANSVTIAKIAKEVCTKLGIQYVEATVSNSAEVKQATESIIDRVDAIYVGTDNTVVSALNSLISVAIKNKKPIISADPSSAETMEIFAAYGFNYYQIGKVTGEIVGDILKGKKVSEMPTRFMTNAKDLELLINLDVAKKLGITIPDDIKKQAVMIVENGKLQKK
jgi:putative tryptophan/tyrosine transport system substrate-binding protein